MNMVFTGKLKSARGKVEYLNPLWSLNTCRLKLLGGSGMEVHVYQGGGAKAN